MSCSHPLKGFYTYGQNELSIDLKYSPNKVDLRSNRKIRVTSYDVDHVELINGRLVNSYDSKVSEFASNSFKEYIEIPCGRCIACRLKRSREWALRCMLEAKYHDQNWFVTLTYSDEYLPFVTDFDDYGNYVTRSTLRKSDLQKFFKRLRKAYKYDNHLKYYACGEYGDSSSRCHFHCIIFGLRLDDLKLYKTSRLGFNYYNSEFLESVWPYGHVVVAECTYDTCAYTARYIMKKQLGLGSAVYDELGIEPEFTTMSLKPAIGYEYFKEHKDKIYDLDSIYLATDRKGLKFKPPKYFDSKMTDNLDDAYKLREVREVRQEVAELQKKAKMSQTDLDYLDVLRIEEDLLENRIKTLYRKEV